MSNRIFFSPDSQRYVLFTANVLSHMYAHAQLRFWQKEAGGEIYSVDPDAHRIIVTAATGPNPGDRRGRCSFNPDIEAAAQDRIWQFAMGRHAVGLWHTHPESQPTPSGRDIRTTEEYLKAFSRDRDRYLMVILGNRGNPLSMTVGSTEQSKWIPWIEQQERGSRPSWA